MSEPDVLFMNQWEVEDVVREHGNDPRLGPAARTLGSLMDAANSNSDGWAYYPKPARSARKLMEIFQGLAFPSWDPRRREPSAQEIKAALSPIKAFRTRSGWDFEIYE